MILIKNVAILGQNNLSLMDILIGGGKILDISPNININLPSIKVIDAEGLLATPGYIDQHVHITGGGGEGGYTTRVPEISARDIVNAGVTTVVGLLGTDGTTRSMENLVAKTKALNEYGLTAYCLTGSYEIPSVTLTGNVKKDIMFIQEVIGVKLALSDHRSSNISLQDLIYLSSDVRLAGLLSGKCGIVTIHMGTGKCGLSPLFELVDKTDIPIKTLRPTHVDKIIDEAIEFANLGGYIDITSREESERTTSAIIKALDKAPLEKITMSTDSNGSMPIWNEKNEMIGMTAGKMTTMHQNVKELINVKGLPMDTAFNLVTKNVAEALEIYPKKGKIAVGSDADINLIDDNLNIITTISNGIVMKEYGEILLKENFINS